MRKFFARLTAPFRRALQTWSETSRAVRLADFYAITLKSHLAEVESLSLIAGRINALEALLEQRQHDLRAHLDEALALSRQETENQIGATRQTLLDQASQQQERLGQQVLGLENIITNLRAHLDQALALARQESDQQAGAARQELAALLAQSAAALRSDTDQLITGLRAHLDQTLAQTRQETTQLVEASQATLGARNDSAITNLRAHLDEALALSRQEAENQIGATRQTLLDQASQQQDFLAKLVLALERTVHQLRGHVDDSLAQTRQETTQLVEASQATLGARTDSAITNLRAHLDEALALSRQEAENQIGATRQTLLDQASQQQEEISQMRSALNDTKAHVARCRQFPFATERGLPDQNTPEESLIAFLFPLLRNRTALDIGAHRGQFSRFLLDTGFSEVYAVEPHPQLIRDLKKIANRQRRLRVIHCAVSGKDGRAPLHLAEPVNGTPVDTDLLLLSTIKPHPMPKGLTFGKTIQAPLRSFTSLLRKGELPREAGLLKIDTEGNENVILRQIPSGAPYETILTEFWGNKFVFHDPRTRRPQAPSLPDYPFTLSLVRHGDGRLTFTANKPAPDQATWGNTFHFENRDLFQAAYQFLQNMVPEAC